MRRKEGLEEFPPGQCQSRTGGALKSAARAAGLPGDLERRASPPDSSQLVFPRGPGQLFNHPLLTMLKTGILIGIIRTGDTVPYANLILESA